ncbi:15299_t:CDS:2 [Cetraspora pellucida]|uniref:15299_t:CDS:1 n=1 Tax=Cetraspora pellucida TaxID=1433469 RepID=A0A9N9IDH4_9GLOM|nr:15299_t:CDS:2 [Cetraspora pellucida]
MNRTQHKKPRTDYSKERVFSFAKAENNQSETTKNDSQKKNTMNKLNSMSELKAEEHIAGWASHIEKKIEIEAKDTKKFNNKQDNKYATEKNKQKHENVSSNKHMLSNNKQEHMNTENVMPHEQNSVDQSSNTTINEQDEITISPNNPYMEGPKEKVAQELTKSEPTFSTNNPYAKKPEENTQANEEQDKLMPISEHPSDTEEEMSMESETEQLNNSTKKDETSNTNWKTEALNSTTAHYLLEKSLKETLFTTARKANCQSEIDLKALKPGVAPIFNI